MTVQSGAILAGVVNSANAILTGDSELRLAEESRHPNGSAASVESTMGRALLQTTVDAIQRLNEVEICTLQGVLNHGETFGYWKTPEKWAPGLPQAQRNINIRERIKSKLAAHHQALLRKLENRDTTSAFDILSLSNGQDKTRAEQIVDGAVLTMSRYLLLLRMGPVGWGKKRGGRSLKPSNVARLGYDIVSLLFGLGTAKWMSLCEAEGDLLDTTPYHPPLETGYLGVLEARDLDKLPDAQKRRIVKETSRMLYVAGGGIWHDVPFAGDAVANITPVAGAALNIPPSPKRQPHLPLPDDYVSQMGTASIWIIEDLAPNLFEIGEEILKIWSSSDEPSVPAEAVAKNRHKLLGRYLSEFKWRSADGKEIIRPPFNIRLAFTFDKHLGAKEDSKIESEIKSISSTDDEWHATHKSEGFAESDDDEDEGDKDEELVVEDMTWPPRRFTQIMGLVNNLQLAHLFVVLMSTAPRRSETITQTRNCVAYERDGNEFLNGRTYKLVESVDGELREWVLPDLTTYAIEQQVRLVNLAEKIGPILPIRDIEFSSTEVASPNLHLWFCSGISNWSASGRIKPLKHLSPALRAYAKTLGLDTKPGGQNLRVHRCRKTVARLVALAITQAPKVLMDVFGHKSIEMTLYYILTDKSLHLEIEQVCREIRVMRAKKAVEAMVAAEDASAQVPGLGGYGGPAALMVRRAINTQREKLHRTGEEWGATNTLELAEILTLQGKCWTLVRPGIICTKFPATESGPCNRSRGRPEPSRCQSDCSHRLEESFLREDVDGAIRDSVAAYVQTGSAGEELMESFWAGQVRAHVIRFEDLRVKWMENPVVQKIFQDPAEQEEQI